MPDMDVVDVAEFPSQRDAETASSILREAGIAFQLRDDEDAVVIVVPELTASAAIERLMYQEQTQANSSPQASAATCPECAGHESHPLNRRVLYVLTLMVATGAGLIAAGYAELAFATMVLFGPALAWFGKDLGKRKCAHCGWKFRATIA